MSILVRPSAVDGRGSVDQCSDAPDDAKMMWPG